MKTILIKIGSRGSELALKQTDIVFAALKAADPSVSVEVHVVQTRGDVDQQPIPLDTIGKGWFTREIEDELLRGEIDIAVHSLKDMAEGMPPGLMIGAYLPREDARDVLITKNGVSYQELKRGAIIGTDSSRRQVQMLALRPDARMKSIRGNVPTRLQKLQSEEYDAIILAAAGLKRLGMEKKITHYFALTDIIPAPGQGILAVQTRRDDTELEQILARINDLEAAQAATLERLFSRTVGGGCKAPTGAYAVKGPEGWTLTAMIAAANGRIIRGEMSTQLDGDFQIGQQLAKSLLITRDAEK